MSITERIRRPTRPPQGGVVHFSAPGGAMTPRHAREADPTDSTRICGSTMEVEAIGEDAGSPRLYRVEPLTRPDFESIWHHLSTGQPLHLEGTALAEAQAPMLLILCTPDSGPPLCVSGEFVEGLGFMAAQLPLSWRLAALDFASRLPMMLEPSNPRDTQASSTTIPGSRRLWIRPRMPAPAHTIAPTPELCPLVVALRAHHRSLEELITDSDVEATRLRSFVCGLYAVRVVTEVPRPLSDDTDPFTYLGLHWSAPPSLIRCTYGRLRRRLPDVANHREDAVALLERAFDLLRHRQDRRRLRHSMVPPPVIGEVLTHLRAELQEMRRQGRTGRSIALCRRIIELDPSDEETQHLQQKLLRT